jgi:hypothetical protein
MNQNRLLFRAAVPNTTVLPIGTPYRLDASRVNMSDALLREIRSGTSNLWLRNYQASAEGMALLVGTDLPVSTALSSLFGYEEIRNRVQYMMMTDEDESDNPDWDILVSMQIHVLIHVVKWH